MEVSRIKHILVLVIIILVGITSFSGKPVRTRSTKKITPHFKLQAKGKSSRNGRAQRGYSFSRKPNTLRNKTTQLENYIIGTPRLNYKTNIKGRYAQKGYQHRRGFKQKYLKVLKSKRFELNKRYRIRSHNYNKKNWKYRKNPRSIFRNSRSKNNLNKRYYTSIKYGTNNYQFRTKKWRDRQNVRFATRNILNKKYDTRKYQFRTKKWRHKFSSTSRVKGEKRKPNQNKSKAARGSSLVPNIDKKLDFVFGKATGSLHNIQRSTTMQRQLNRIGIFDNAAGRSYLNGHLGKVLNNSKSILSSEGGFITRESLLMGPNGGLKMQSVWKGRDLITIKLMGR